jgi:hypothetical protein
MNTDISVSEHEPRMPERQRLRVRPRVSQSLDLFLEQTEKRNRRAH